jgi:hypothetical protein
MLDDPAGTPVELKGKPYGSFFTAFIPRGMYRDEWTGRRDEYYETPNHAWQFKNNGIFYGGTAKSMYRIVNADTSADDKLDEVFE